MAGDSGPSLSIGSKGIKPGFIKKKIVRRIFLFGFCFFGVLGVFFVAVPVLFWFFFLLLGFFCSCF